jgi:hypothetical protein
MEVGSSQLASGRVTQYTAAHAVPLADVKAQVREQLVNERAAELAKQGRRSQARGLEDQAPTARPSARR